MTTYRKLSEKQRTALQTQGCCAENWDDIEVAPEFDTATVHATRFAGRVRLGGQVRLYGVGLLKNYSVGRGACIENTAVVECRTPSAFGNGTVVRPVNEAGGREVTIYCGLTAQTAYLCAMWRHRPLLAPRIARLAEEFAGSQRSELGTVGEGATVRGCGFVRECSIGSGTTVEGALCLENGTVEGGPGGGARVGCGVTARDFIISRGAEVGTGACLERCFVGEGCRIGKGFSAVDSLFFANCECENGEACAVFAGPYTVSHHRSSLLIAGFFSFFNAGSGTNQSNHLFKAGAIHQAVHRRGCKFASDAYTMAPCVEAPFTTVIGRHKSHHDTDDFPFSYLLESEGRSMLMPGANLRSYGTVRDIAKWERRDRRRAPEAERRDQIIYARYNPYIAQGALRAIAVSQELLRKEGDTLTYKHVRIKKTMLRLGLKSYDLLLRASLGEMLGTEARSECDGTGSWTDIAGLYAPKREAERIAEALENGEAGLAEADARFAGLARSYRDYARSWALDALARRLGHAPSAEEIRAAVADGEQARAALDAATAADSRHDCGMEFAVGYGTDADPADPAQAAEIEADYRAVRGELFAE